MSSKARKAGLIGQRRTKNVFFDYFSFYLEGVGTIIILSDAETVTLVREVLGSDSC